MGTFTLQNAADLLFPVWADAAAKGCLILVATAMVALFMRRASAASRHWVWFLGIAGLLLIPMASIVLPGWHILPSIEMSRETSVSPSTSPPPSSIP